mmetsp:Transcript_7049/g.18097  ORF Transcript_7049/g.18097 Transcript_7049/m.18097 type:complete len:793 (-) Transcript_7049:294-2672(-)|eukprot:CAMPEP_0113887876 /NCGR_PEP_ID=MMETSP0780_2-20120614/12497_1 /TAXON_ID=652834 /ORGANISM="Palpitomonas bilix" /LENGTH=792 /DNA_ID=CAMNT_0000876537 /DNA_START=767 /DNA_END=3145 /DNA_ORIENTATION=+ /assembly_acc=CAM_ASM_000599
MSPPLSVRREVTRTLFWGLFRSQEEQYHLDSHHDEAEEQGRERAMVALKEMLLQNVSETELPAPEAHLECLVFMFRSHLGGKNLSPQQVAQRALALLIQKGTLSMLKLFLPLFLDSLRDLDHALVKHAYTTSIVLEDKMAKYRLLKHHGFLGDQFDEQIDGVSVALLAPPPSTFQRETAERGNPTAPLKCGLCPLPRLGSEVSHIVSIPPVSLGEVWNVLEADLHPVCFDRKLPVSLKTLLCLFGMSKLWEKHWGPSGSWALLGASASQEKEVVRVLGSSPENARLQAPSFLAWEEEEASVRTEGEGRMGVCMRWKENKMLWIDEETYRSRSAFRQFVNQCVVGDRDAPTQYLAITIQMVREMGSSLLKTGGWVPFALTVRPASTLFQKLHVYDNGWVLLHKHGNCVPLDREEGKRKDTVPIRPEPLTDNRNPPPSCHMEGIPSSPTPFGCARETNFGAAPKGPAGPASVRRAETERQGEGPVSKKRNTGRPPSSRTAILPSSCPTTILPPSCPTTILPPCLPGNIETGDRSVSEESFAPSIFSKERLRLRMNFESLDANSVDKLIREARRMGTLQEDLAKQSWEELPQRKPNGEESMQPPFPPEEGRTLCVDQFYPILSPVIGRKLCNDLVEKMKNETREGIFKFSLSDRQSAFAIAKVFCEVWEGTVKEGPRAVLRSLIEKMRPTHPLIASKLSLEGVRRVVELEIPSKYVTKHVAKLRKLLPLLKQSKSRQEKSDWQNQISRSYRMVRDTMALHQVFLFDTFEGKMENRLYNVARDILSAVLAMDQHGV